MIMRQLTLFLLPILFCWTIAAYGENDVIIDVRTLEEWHAGHLESATHIELQYVAQSIEAVVPNKDQKYICTAAVAIVQARLKISLKLLATVMW